VTVVKPKYNCPQCAEEFTRKWNMRAHCRNKHNYDPLPNQARKKYGFSGYPAGKAKNAINPNFFATQTAIKRITVMMNDLSRFTRLRWGPVLKQGGLDLGGPEYSLLNSLVDDYVIVRKRDISGISGYLCEICWSFEFRYINNIGFDLTAGEAHRCGPTMLSRSNLENRMQIQNELIKQKDDSLVNLTNSLFPENKVLRVDSDLVNEVKNFRAPKIKLDQIVPEHWACKPLLEREMELSDYELRRVIADMGGTFAQIIIENGDFAGSHLMYIT
jgi:hypothetical protein